MWVPTGQWTTEAGFGWADMDRKKKIRLAVLAAAALLYLGSFWAWKKTQPFENRVPLVLSKPVNAAEAQRIWDAERGEEAPVGFCFWGEAGEQMVSCRETGASARVNRIALWGNPELLGAGSLAWRDGCLVDRKTAQTLFGTDRCENQTLTAGEKRLPVVGIFSDIRPTMVSRAEGNQDHLNRCVLAVPSAQGKVQGEAFLMRWGLEGTVLDFYPFQALCRNLLLLFPGVLLGSFGLSLKKERKNLTLEGIRSRKQLRLLGKSLLGIAILLGSLWLLGRQVTIPRDMIPSRWSDFSFWSRWWDEQRENFQRILTAPLGSEWLQMQANMVKSMVCSTVSAMLALWAVRRENHADTAD